MDGITQVRVRPDRRDSASLAQLLHRVRAEFRDMLGLRLTCAQAQRLFGMRPDVCDRVLAALLEEGTLTCGSDARYGVPAEFLERGFTPGIMVERRTPKAS